MALIGALNILLGMDAAKVVAGAKKAVHSLGEIEKHAHRAAHAMETIKTGLEAVGIGVGLTEAVEFFKSSVEAYREAEQQQRKLEAVLEATGHAAGYTSQQLGVLNSQLQSTTNYDDDAIAGAEAVLATFKQIQGVQFTQAIESMVDLSAVLGQDLQSSALQLGKALNDPVRGITALRRAGVSFTEQQQAQIKAMVAAGDVVGAQKVILGELKSEFGGAAAAMRDDMTGLANDWGDLKEAIGSLVDNGMVQDWLIGTAALVRGLGETVKTSAAGWQMLSDLMHGDKLAFATHVMQANAPEAQSPKSQGESPRSPAAAGNDTALASVDKLVAKLKEEADLYGLTGTAREIAKLAAQGLSDAELEEVRALELGERQRKAATEAMEAQRKAAASLAGDIDAFTDALRKQLETYGMSSDAVKLWELEQRGATEAQLAEAQALKEKLDALDAQKKKLEENAAATQKMADAAKRVWDETRTPEEQYAARLKELQEMLDKTAIDQDTFNRAKAKAAEDFGMGTAKPSHEGDARPKALELGSAEAFHASFGNKDNDSRTWQQMLAALIKQQRDTDRLKQIAESNRTSAASFG